MIIALQFYVGDQHKTLALARLLADIEKVRRDDVLLGLICQPDTPDTSDIQSTVEYCNRKIPTLFVRSSRGAMGYFNGSGELWSGTMTYFSDNTYGHSSVFTVDGGDSVPLRKSWINDLKLAHKFTHDNGKSITGSYAPGPVVNGNMIIDLDVWRDNPSLHSLLPTTSLMNTFERQFASVLVPKLCTPGVLYIEYLRHGICVQGLHDRAVAGDGYSWLHGYKDDDLVDKARQHIFSYFPESTEQGNGGGQGTGS
jgi:hypothetical protein